MDFAEGGVEEGLAGLDLAFGEVPSAVAEDEEHGAIGSEDDSAGGSDVAHVSLEEAEEPEGEVEGVIFIADEHGMMGLLEFELEEGLVFIAEGEGGCGE